MTLVGKKITVEQLECTRCSYKWYPRIQSDGTIEVPGTCPKCRSKYWNKLRIFPKGTHPKHK